MVVIAYNYSNKVIGIVNARSKELAIAYWQGKEIYPHSTKILEEDWTPLEEHPTGVYPILETIEVSGYSIDKSKTLLCIK